MDDLLDEDPDGLHHRVGTGTAANAALAFQGLASHALEHAEWPEAVAGAAQASLGRCALETARGQNLDLSDAEGEESYWRAVRAKTPPLFGCALYLGALAGSAAPETAREIERLSLPLGDIVQIGDDLGDALARPAAADWSRRWGNLPILYAHVADHPGRARFAELAMRVFDDSDALEEAQRLLVTSGAVSYCAYRLLEAYKAGMGRIAELGLPNPAPLEELFHSLLQPLRGLLERVGIEGADRLFAV